MIYLIFFVVCFAASIIGAVCGIGGGIIIKPVLDAFHVFDVSEISFLSGCTVLAMATYSVIKSRTSGETKVKRKVGIPLALGAAVGGLFGKWLFSYLKNSSMDNNMIGAIQAACLLVVTIGTLFYVFLKTKIKTKQVESSIACILIGISLGGISSFLGIGGGPINLVVLFYFFSMGTKAAASASLYIIFLSQAVSLFMSIVMGSVPVMDPGVLILMITGGIAGGICGCALNSKIKEKAVEKLFIGLMIVIIIINIYNIYKFM